MRRRDKLRLFFIKKCVIEEMNRKYCAERNKTCAVPKLQTANDDPI